MLNARRASYLVLAFGFASAAFGAEILISDAKSQPEILRISVLTINGDKGSVAVIKDGLQTPTGVEPAGDTL